MMILALLVPILEFSFLLVITKVHFIGILFIVHIGRITSLTTFSGNGNSVQYLGLIRNVIDHRFGLQQGNVVW
jgi:hypothetical protein